MAATPKRARLAQENSNTAEHVCANKRMCIVLLLLAVIVGCTSTRSTTPQLGTDCPRYGARHKAVESLRVHLLATAPAHRVGIGTRGFAAPVETDGRRILYDTGGYADTVLRNARLLGFDLSTVADVVLGHSHPDHTSGLLALRREFHRDNERARVNV